MGGIRIVRAHTHTSISPRARVTESDDTRGESGRRVIKELIRCLEEALQDKRRRASTAAHHA